LSTYDVIGVDAYRLPYIPWQLTTREFFEEARSHLSPRGVVVINVGRTPNDRRIVEAMVGTLHSVFPSVHVLDVPATLNSILYATVGVTDRANLEENYLALASRGGDPLLVDIVGRTLGNLQPTPASSTVFTDDWAPIEQLTNSVAIRFLLSNNLSILR
jgi:hypothetical protein